MDRRIVAAAALLSFVCSAANATSCDEVKAKIEDKIKARGVKSYTLEVVAAAEAQDHKVVGSCERGGKKIVYTRK